MANGAVKTPAGFVPVEEDIEAPAGFAPTVEKDDPVPQGFVSLDAIQRSIDKEVELINKSPEQRGLDPKNLEKIEAALQDNPVDSAPFIVDMVRAVGSGATALGANALGAIEMINNLAFGDPEQGDILRSPSEFLTNPIATFMPFKIGNLIPSFRRVRMEGQEDIAKIAMRINRKAAEFAPKTDSWIKNQIFGATQSSVQTIPGLILGAITKNPSIGLAAIGVTSGGAASLEARQKGLKGLDRQRYALLRGYIEAGTELIPFNAALGPGKSFLKRAFGMLIGDVPGELLANYLGDVVDKQYISQDTPKRVTLSDVADSFREAWDDLSAQEVIDTTTQTLIATGLQSGTVHGLQKSLDLIETHKLRDKFTKALGERIESKRLSSDITPENVQKLKRLRAEAQGTVVAELSPEAKAATKIDDVTDVEVAEITEEAEAAIEDAPEGFVPVEEAPPAEKPVKPVVKKEVVQEVKEEAPPPEPELVEEEDIFKEEPVAPEIDTALEGSEVKRRRFAQRLLNDPRLPDEVRLGITNVDYVPKAQTVTIDQSKAIIEAKGHDRAAKMVKDLGNNLEPDVRNTVGQQIVTDLSAAVKEASDRGDTNTANKLSDAANDMANFLLEQGTKQGRGIKSFGIWGKLQPASIVRQATKLIKSKAKQKIKPVKTFKKTADIVKKISDKIIRSRKRLAATDQIKKRIEKDLIADPEKSTIWKRYKTQFAERLKGRVGAFLNRAGKRRKAALAEFTEIMTTLALKQLPQAEVSKMSFEERMSRTINDAIKNPEKYKQARAEAKRVIKEKFGDSQDMLETIDAIFGPVFGKPYTDRQLQRMVRDSIKDLDVNINEVIRSHYDVAKEAKADIVSDIRKKLGLKQNEAKFISDEIRREFNKIAQKRAETVVSGILKTRVPSRVLKKVRDKVIEQVNLGNFDPRAPRETITKKLNTFVRQALSELDINMDRLVRQDKVVQEGAREDLIAKLTDDVGLSDVDAKALAKEIGTEFDTLARARIESIINRATKDVPKRKIKSAIDKMMEAINIGNFDQMAMETLLSKEIGTELTPEQIAKIQELATDIKATPQQFKKNEKIVQMLSFVDSITGKPTKADVAFSLWYANILSGHQTQLRNIISTASNAFNDVVISSTINRVNPAASLWQMVKGMVQGITDATIALKTGISPIRTRIKVEGARGLEGKRFTGILKPLNAWKFVGRAMDAQDVIFYKGAERAKRYILSKKLANDEGLTGRDLRRRVAEIMDSTPEDVARFREMAEKEGLKGIEKLKRIQELIDEQVPESMREEASAFAAEATFNYDSDGALGLLGKKLGEFTRRFPAFRFVVPFTRIVANVTNRSIDYTPWGYPRMFLASKEGPLARERRATHFAKASIGTILSVAAALLDASEEDKEDPKFVITAAGPSNFNKRKQWRAAGGKPYTITVNGKKYNYLLTPLAIPFTIVGHIRDAQKFDDLDEKELSVRASAAMAASAKAVVNLSYLNTAAGLFSTIDRQSATGVDAGMRQLIARNATSVVPNLVKQIDKAFDPSIQDADSLAKNILQYTPIARKALNPAINVLGEPVIVDTSLFVTDTKKHPIFTPLVKKKVFITVPSKLTKIGNRVIDPDEYYDLIKESGVLIKRGITNLMKDDKLLDKSPAEIKERVDKISKAARNIVKARILVRAVNKKDRSVLLGK